MFWFSSGYQSSFESLHGRDKHLDLFHGKNHSFIRKFSVTDKKAMGKGWFLNQINWLLKIDDS